MNSLSLVMMNVYKMIYQNEDIRKYLYHPSENYSDDPLNKNTPSDGQIQPYIKKVSSDYLIQYILDPDDDTKNESVKRGYITVFNEDYDRMDNPYARNSAFRIEIYMPIRGFEEYQYRITLINEILFELLQQKRVEGSFGRLILDRSFQINPNIKGYTGYALIFNAGEVVSAI